MVVYDSWYLTHDAASVRTPYGARFRSQTGAMQLDEAVVQYMTKLEEHRRKCEVEGRYQEAKLASRRLADLRTAQVGGRGLGSQKRNE